MLTLQNVKWDVVLYSIINLGFEKEQMFVCGHFPQKDI